MIHLPALITDLGFILVIAALATLLFKKLGQPLVLGYLIAGFLVSPHVPFVPTITDSASISVWSEIGVIFLLFSLGLEFSFKKLFKVGRTAGFTAIFEVVSMAAFGYFVGQLVGWNKIDSLFFGCILSMSSTTIIVRAFDELGLKGQRFVELVFGILIVEDIIAIFLLVLLTAIAGSQAVSGGELAFSGLRLVFYIALWFVVGIFLIPIFLRKIRSLLEEETLLLVSIGLCFLMVIIAANVGFSPALGAFVMGSLLAETPEGHKVEHLLKPVKDLFAAIFFVSVGMMIDPQVLRDHWNMIILVVFITVVGKGIATFLGAFLAGEPRKQAFQAGMSLAQIGEFSFLIASLGVTLKVTSDFLYPLAIATSAVTTFTTPYLIKMSDTTFKLLDARLPEPLKRAFDRYSEAFDPNGNDGLFSLVFKTYGVKVLLNTVVVVAIIGAFKVIIEGPLHDFLEESHWAGYISLMICLILTAPFLWGIVASGPSLKQKGAIETLERLRGFQLGVIVVRVSLAVTLLSVILAQFVTLKLASWVVLGVVVVTTLSGHFWGKRLYQFLEKNFLKNLTEKEKQELMDKEVARHILPWEASLGSYDVFPDSSLAGKTLKDVHFKENYGVTVAAIVRGKKRYFAPNGDFMVWPYDKIVCFGSEEELLKFNKILEQEKHYAQAENNFVQRDLKLESFEIDEKSPYLNKTIRETAVRESGLGMIVGIERGTRRILGPTGSFMLKLNDLVWFVADQNQGRGKRSEG